MKLFLDLPHLKVVHTKTGSTILDDALARRGLSRRVAFILPSYSGILPIIKNTDICAVLPPSWLRIYGSPAEFSVSDMPISDFDFTVDQFSKSAQDQDAGLRWLRKLILEEFRLLRSAVAGQPAPGLVDRADIAAGAEGAVADAADQQGAGLRIFGPAPQHRREGAIHPKREGI